MFINFLINNYLGMFFEKKNKKFKNKYYFLNNYFNFF